MKPHGVLLSETANRSLATADAIERAMRQRGLSPRISVEVEEVDNEYMGKFVLSLRLSPWKRVGVFHVSDVNRDGVWSQEPTTKCVKDFAEVQRRAPHIKELWLGRFAELFDPDLRGKGIGSIGYHAMLQACSRHNAAMGSHDCIVGGHMTPAGRKAMDRLPGKRVGFIHWLPR